MKNAISASMMCADISDLKGALNDLEKSGTEYLHIDVMDGTFVQNYTLGTDYCRQLKKLTEIPLDIHLMITAPELKIGWFDFGAGDIVSVHAESTPHLQKVLTQIRAKGALAYVALNPATPLNVVEEVIDDIDGVMLMTVNPGFAGQKMVSSAPKKIARLRNLLASFGKADLPIEVDGNVSFANAKIMKEAGANIFVAGSSSIFSSDCTLYEGCMKLREVID